MEKKYRALGESGLWADKDDPPKLKGHQHEDPATKEKMKDFGILDDLNLTSRFFIVLS